MKYLKWAAGILIVIAVAAVIAWLRRDSIARDIANSVLAGQDIAVTRLSVDSLDTNRIRFSTIVLEHGNGTRFEIEGLQFPLSVPSVRPERLSAERVIVTLPEQKGEGSPYAPYLQTVLNLPTGVPNTEVTVAHLSVADVVDASGIAWRTEGPDQGLALDIAGVHASVDIVRVSDDEHRAAIRAARDGIDGMASLDLVMTHTDAGFGIAGFIAMDAAQWLPLLQELDVFPGGFTAIDAELGGPIEIALDGDGPGSVVSTMHLTLTDTLAAWYRTAGNSDVRLRAASAEPATVVFRYPSLEWVAGMTSVDGSVGFGDLGDLQVRLTNLECRSGIHCAMDSRLSAGPIAWPQFGAESLELSAPLGIDVSAPSVISLSPAATLIMTGIESPALTVSTLRASDVAGAKLTVGDAGWSAAADRLALVLETVSNETVAVASLPMTLSDLRVADSADSVEARLSVPARTASLSLGTSQFHLPGIEGGIRRKGTVLGAALVLSGSKQGLSASTELTHDLSTGRGSARVPNANLVFDRARLSNRLVKWPYPFDVVAGTWQAALDVAWQSGGDALRYRVTMSHSATGLAGNYNDIAFVGLDSALTGTLDSESGLSIAPATVNIELIDVGMPLEHVSASVVPDVQGRSVQVDSLSGSALGGQLMTDPFVFSAAADSNEVLLRLQSIQLQFMVDILEFEDLEMSGSLSGVLPVTISDKTITISKGRLENEPPGGVIHYRSGEAIAASGTSGAGLGIASKALGNFEFDSLTSDVEYSASGDLKLKMRMSGINPDMDPTQPIILNLGVENNIPQLLRSLQAIRSIEDIIQRKSGQ